jgi:hypothetical protein
MYIRTYILMHTTQKSRRKKASTSGTMRVCTRIGIYIFIYMYIHIYVYIYIHINAHNTEIEAEKGKHESLLAEKNVHVVYI